jgi:hypothetical protein
MHIRRIVQLICGLALLTAGAALCTPASLAFDRRFEIDPRLLQQPPQRSAPSAGQPLAADRKEGGSAKASGQASRAKAGETKRRSSGKPHQARRTPRPAETLQQFRMVSMAAPAQGAAIEALRQFWPQLVAAQPPAEQQLEVAGQNFALAVDTSRYPSLPAADGGKIIIDSSGSLPPLVRSLLGQGGDIRIVSDHPGNRRSFMSSLFKAARFYSVEENFAVDFGSDPKVTVTADYRIEKSADSLLKQEVVLFNAQDGRRAMPSSLVSFLGLQGFQVVEPFAVNEPRPAYRGQLVQISATTPPAIADGLLRSLALPFESDRRVELYGLQDAGFSLQVKADRYFERGNERFVINYFTGDPVGYTLSRLLETRGFRVITLEEKDDFSRVSEKLLGKLRLPGRYGRHSLWGSGEVPYAIQMSGVMLTPGGGAPALFVTDRHLDMLVRDMLDAGGYQVATTY